MCFWHTFVDYFLSIPPQVYRFSGPVFTDRWMSSSWLLISAQCPSYLTFHSLDMKTTRSSAMLQPWQLCLEHPRACPMEGGGCGKSLRQECSRIPSWFRCTARAEDHCHPSIRFVIFSNPWDWLLPSWSLSYPGYLFYPIKKSPFRGVPVVVQRTRIRLGTMRLQVWSLASILGLKIQHCCELWCRSQTRLGSGIAVAVM